MKRLAKGFLCVIVFEKGCFGTPFFYYTFAYGFKAPIGETYD